MRMRAPWRSIAVLTVLAAAGFARAEVKEVAELLPAQTLACVEVHQPDKLAREIAALLKGSDLDDLPAVVARYRERMNDDENPWSFLALASVGGALSPEIINECGRIQGAAVAVTAVNKDGPEVVFVVLAGDSNIPTFFMRVFLLASSSAHTMAEVEGVRIYRYRFEKSVPPPPPGQPRPPRQWEESGPYMALLPSAVVLGSSKDGVADVIRRYKGKSSDPSLASVATYHEAAKRRDKPGFYGYADLAALGQQMDEQGKDLGSMEGSWKAFKTLVNPKAMRTATAALTLQDGVVEFRVQGDLDPKEVSPLAELLTTKAAAPEVLYFTPRDGRLTLSLNLSDGEKRWQQLLDLNDRLDKSDPLFGGLITRSTALHVLEGQLKFDIGKDVLGRLAGAALVMEPTATGDPNARPFPLLVLQATDEDAAKYLEEQGVPKLLGLAALIRGMGGEPPTAVRVDMDGRSSSVVKAVGLSDVLNAKSLYISREGAFVVVGPDYKTVAAALNAGAKKTGLLSEEKTAVAIKELGDPTAIGVFSTRKNIVEGYKLAERGPLFGTPATTEPVPPPVPEVKDNPTPKLSKRAEQTIADVTAAVEPLPPLVLGVSRTPDALTLEIKQAGLKGVTQKLIDLWIESWMENTIEQSKPPAK